ncbi:hypothetical protein D3C77_15560 [compost metagenome]
MALLLLLPLLVSGYLVCLKDPIVYYKLHRYEGQLLYLQVGRFGIYCFLYAFAIMTVVTLVFSHDLGNFCVDPALQLAFLPRCYDYSLDFLSALGGVAQRFGLATHPASQSLVFGVLTGLLTLLMPSLWAWSTRRELKDYLKTEEEEEITTFLTRETLSHSPMGKTLIDAFVFKKPVMISMTDRKVYVGLIQSIGAPTEVTGVDLEVKLRPSFSGHRDKDTLKVSFTHTYPTDISILQPIYFKQENIVSITLFSEAIRDSFQAEKPGNSATRWYEDMLGKLSPTK